MPKSPWYRLGNPELSAMGLTGGIKGHFVVVLVPQEILSIVEAATSEPLWDVHDSLRGIHHLKGEMPREHSAESLQQASAEIIWPWPRTGQSCALSSSVCSSFWVTPAVLRSHSGCWGSKLDQSGAKQVLFPLCSL